MADGVEVCEEGILREVTTNVWIQTHSDSQIRTSKRGRLQPEEKNKQVDFFLKYSTSYMLAEQQFKPSVNVHTRADIVRIVCPVPIKYACLINILNSNTDFNNNEQYIF